MNGQRILVPIDVWHSKTDTLLCLQQMAAQSPVCATLLYVVELNIVQPDRLLEGRICAEGESILHKLAARFLGHPDAARVRVRIGHANEEILAEARANRSELILMSSPKPRGWHRLFRSRTVERVVQFAPCPTLVLPLSWPVNPGERQPQARQQEAVLLSSPSLRPTWATM